MRSCLPFRYGKSCERTFIQQHIHRNRHRPMQNQRPRRPPASFKPIRKTHRRQRPMNGAPGEIRSSGIGDGLEWFHGSDRIQGFPRRSRTEGVTIAASAWQALGGRTRGNKLSARWRLAFRCRILWWHCVVRDCASSSALFFGNLRFGTRRSVCYRRFFYYAQSRAISRFTAHRPSTAFIAQWLSPALAACAHSGDEAVRQRGVSTLRLVPFAAALALQFPSMRLPILLFASRTSCAALP